MDVLSRGNEDGKARLKISFEMPTVDAVVFSSFNAERRVNPGMSRLIIVVIVVVIIVISSVRISVCQPDRP